MKRLWIDADTAGDDATSLLFGLLWPNVALEGIGVVAGNVNLEQATRNALCTVEMAKRPDVPVYAGADRPLMRPLFTSHYVHGRDGMGDSDLPEPGVRPAGAHAVDALIEAARSFGRDLVVIAQGPLTNLALAFMRDPDLPAKIGRVWIMGGANNALGNVTPAAEFNFYVDPEAAHMVLSAGFDITLVPWDVCIACGVLERDELQPVLDMDTELSEFYLAVNRTAWEYVRARRGGLAMDGIVHSDSLVAAMVIDESLVAERGRYFVGIEHRGDLTRGYSLVDIGAVLHRAPNADVVLRADKARFRDMLFRLLAGRPG